MRTKTLLAAAVLAAGIATSMAQSNVYSLNVVGYVNQVYPVGFSMVATPLKTSNNIVSQVIPTAPNGTLVYKFTGGAFETANSYSTLFNVWSSPNQTLPPGQGYFIKSPVQWTNTFVGEVVQNNTNALINGFNMIGSAWSAAGTIDTALGLVPSNGDTAYMFNNGVGYELTPRSYSSLFNTWSGGAPFLNVAQGVMYKSVGAKNWVQNFSIP
jgi:hypothetical protein